MGVLAAASGALLALRRALGSGRLDPARPSGLHHTTAQEVCDGLWGELRQRCAATAVSGVVEAAREAVKVAPGCPDAECLPSYIHLSIRSAIRGSSSCSGSAGDQHSRCYLGVGNWCLRHSPSYLLLLSRASRFAHDMVSLAACGGGGKGGGRSGGGGGGGGGGGTAGCAGASSDNSSGSSTTPAHDDVGGFLHSLRLHSLLSSLASAVLEVPPPPPRQLSPVRPHSGDAGAGADVAAPSAQLPPLCLPDDPDHNLPPHVATCLTVSICHVASCCCMLASSEVLGTDVLHAWAMEGEGRAAGSDGDCGVLSIVMRVLDIGLRSLKLLHKLQHQATQDALGEEHQRGLTAHTAAGGGGAGCSTSTNGSSGWAALAALRLQRRLGVWLGSQGLSVLQTGLGKAGGQEGQSTAHGLQGVSGGASAHAGAVRAVTHLLLAAPYLVVWGALAPHCVPGTPGGMGYVASRRLRGAVKECSSALHATWQLHTSHPQLRLPLPGEPQAPPPAAATSTANPRSDTVAAAAAYNSVGPLTLAYIAHLAVLISARDPAMHNVQEAQPMESRLSRVEMLAWALAGATVAAEAWLRLEVQGQGQGPSAGAAAGDRTDVGLVLVTLVNQLVERVRQTVFAGPDGEHHVSTWWCAAGSA